MGVGRQSCGPATGSQATRAKLHRQQKIYGLVLDPSQKLPIWASLALALNECQRTFIAVLRFLGGSGGMAKHTRKVQHMAFRPLHDRVLVRRVEAEAKTAGGIIIPDTAQEKPQEGEVVSVGTGSRAEDGTVTPLDVKAGDKILFGKWSGTEVKIDGEDLLIMKESDILGIVS